MKLSWRRAGPGDRELAWVWGGAALAAVVSSAVWKPLSALLPVCWLKATTGIPCPSCGATGAVLALREGNVTGALQANPLLTLGGLAFVVGGLLAPIWVKIEAPIPRARFTRKLALTLVALIAVQWAYLIVRRA